MKKKFFYAALAIVALASCADKEYIGESPSPNPNSGPETAIVFNSGTKALTRATKTGAEAATLLNENFIFAGTKNDGTPAADEYVFDQYNANWVANTANTTESNSSDWEYVGYTPAETTSLPDGATQAIKYWDYSKTQYDFAAYSLGGSDAEATAITFDDMDNGSYTLTGSADELKACYISDLVTAYNRDNVSDFGKVVQFSFRSLATKIRFAFYETIPGYSVKEVQFYNKAEFNAITKTFDTSASATASEDDEFVLLTADDDDTLPTQDGDGVMTISFPTTGWANSPHDGDDTDYNKAHVTFDGTTGETTASLTFGALADFATAGEGVLTSTDGNFIGRASNLATYVGGLDGTEGHYYTILPNEDPENLMIRIKFTLVSTDGSEEEIVVDNASAVIPAELAKWSPNYAYTYIFKISDLTNGSTGEDGEGNIVYGLTPITLNAVVVDSEDGVQETITTVSEPSITTYTKGEVVTTQSEYSTDAPIYIIVNDGLANVAYDADKFKLYTVDIEGGANQSVSEKSVHNAYINGTNGTAYDAGTVLDADTSLDGYYTYNDATGEYTACAADGEADGTTTYYKQVGATLTVTDANGKKLTLTESNLLAESEKIEAEDSPTGNEIIVDGAKFTPTDAGTYVFQYIQTADVAGVYDAVVDGTTLTAGTQYFTSADGKGGFVSDGTQVADNANGYDYWTENTPPTPGVYAYKIIIVQ